MNFPSTLKYTQEHEWAKIEGDTLIVGITDHAQSSLGDIVYVELPAQGRELKLGETFGVVESIKAVSDLFSPAAGVVVEINSGLTGDPSQINQKPYDSWMIKIQLKDQPKNLMDATEYTSFVEKIK